MLYDYSKEKILNILVLKFGYLFVFFYRIIFFNEFEYGKCF